MIELLLNRLERANTNPKFGWLQTTPYPTKIRSNRSATIAGKIYTFGGSRPQVGDEPYGDYSYTNTFRVFDPADSTYTDLVGTPIGRTNAAVCQYNDKFYMIGGYQNSSTLDLQLWVYDPVTVKWTAYAGPAGTLQVQHLTPAAGMLWLTRYNNVSQRTELHRWNPASPGSGWTKMTDLPVAQLNNGPIIGVGTTIWYFGGRVGGGVGTNAVWYYNTATGGWTQVNPLPVGSDSFRPFLIGNAIFIIDTQPTGTMRIYRFNGTDAILQTQVAPLPTAVIDAGMAVVGSDIHVIGGFSADVTPAGLTAQHAVCTTG